MSQLKDLPAGPLHRPPLEGFMICLLEEKTDLLEQAGLQHKSQVLEQLYFQLCLCACVRVMGKLTENTIKGRHGFCVRDNSIGSQGNLTQQAVVRHLSSSQHGRPTPFVAQPQWVRQ